MSDFLTPLIDAYRAENPPQALDARALRTRILQASARRDQSPARHLKWLVPVVAAFIGSAAFAATPVARPFVTHLWAHVAALVTASPAPRAHVVRAPSPARPALTLAPHPDLPRSLPLTAPPPEPPGTAPSDLSAPARLPETRLVPARAHSAGRSSDANSTPSEPTAARSAAAVAGSTPAVPAPEAVPAAESAPPPPVPPAVAPLAPDLSAYQVAHRLHFTNGDYARAFVAWNGYLTRFPHGTFAPEARLNRAVCLARLGRSQEARAELGAIAGAGGSYAAQAERLLDAMRPRE